MQLFGWRNRVARAYIIMVDFETILQSFLLFDEIIADRIGGVCFAMSASSRTALGIVIVLFRRRRVENKIDIIYYYRPSYSPQITQSYGILESSSTVKKYTERH